MQCMKIPWAYRFDLPFCNVYRQDIEPNLFSVNPLLGVFNRRCSPITISELSHSALSGDESISYSGAEIASKQFAPCWPKFLHSFHSQVNWFYRFPLSTKKASENITYFLQESVLGCAINPFSLLCCKLDSITAFFLPKSCARNRVSFYKNLFPCQRTWSTSSTIWSQKDCIRKLASLDKILLSCGVINQFSIIITKEVSEIRPSYLLFSRICACWAIKKSRDHLLSRKFADKFGLFPRESILFIRNWSIHIFWVPKGIRKS